MTDGILLAETQSDRLLAAYDTIIPADRLSPSGTDCGLVAYIDSIVKATAQQPIPIYLYHYPQQSGLHWHVALVKRLLDTFGARIVGLKDASGDMAYAREAAAIATSFKVFPSTEAVLLEARSGVFAGCIGRLDLDRYHLMVRQRLAELQIQRCGSQHRDELVVDVDLDGSELCVVGHSNRQSSRSPRAR